MTLDTVNVRELRSIIVRRERAIASGDPETLAIEQAGRRGSSRLAAHMTLREMKEILARRAPTAPDVLDPDAISEILARKAVGDERAQAAKAKRKKPFSYLTPHTGDVVKDVRCLAPLVAETSMAKSPKHGYGTGGDRLKSKDRARRTKTYGNNPPAPVGRMDTDGFHKSMGRGRRSPDPEVAGLANVLANDQERRNHANATDRTPDVFTYPSVDRAHKEIARRNRTDRLGAGRDAMSALDLEHAAVKVAYKDALNRARVARADGRELLARECEKEARVLRAAERKLHSKVRNTRP